MIIIINIIQHFNIATNRIEAIDPAVLRPGRFDEHIHVQRPNEQVQKKEFICLHGQLIRIYFPFSHTMLFLYNSNDYQLSKVCARKCQLY